MRKTRILVVDDEHLIRWSLEQNLKKQGYEVFTAGNGEDALRLVREEQPDLVLLDIQLPGISGIELLTNYPKTTPAQKVMVITAYASLTTAMESIKAGACDFLVKPLMHDEMKRAVRKALDKPK